MFISSKTRRGFTILEVLVATALVCLVLVLIFSIVSTTSSGIRRNGDRVSAYRDAREAFDLMTRALSQATLDTYYDYYDAGFKARQDIARAGGDTGSFLPTLYGRYSDLHFISGPDLLPSAWNQVTDAVFFQAPLNHASLDRNVGLNGALNVSGFFISFQSDRFDLPDFIPSQHTSPKHRFRLYRMVQPTEAAGIYQAPARQWFETPLASALSSSTSLRSAGVFPLADNIIALVILPKLSATETTPPLSSDFAYNSRTSWTAGDQPVQMHQLPPLLEIVLVAMDETSALHLFDGVTSSTQAQAKLGVNLGGLFRSSANLDQDLRTLETALSANRIGYRVFRTTLPLRSGKWSQITSS